MPGGVEEAPLIPSWLCRIWVEQSLPYKPSAWAFSLLILHWAAMALVVAMFYMSDSSLYCFLMFMVLLWTDAIDAFVNCIVPFAPGAPLEKAQRCLWRARQDIGLNVETEVRLSPIGFHARINVNYPKMILCSPWMRPAEYRTWCEGFAAAGAVLSYGDDGPVKPRRRTDVVEPVAAPPLGWDPVGQGAA